MCRKPESKAFFFEKKKQKTLMTWAGLSGDSRDSKQKFFGSFFQKRTLFLLFLCAAAEDPIIAQRGPDQITASEARALIAGTDAETRHKLSTDRAALQEFLRNLLVQRALLEQADAEGWARRPDVAALLRRAHDQVIAQSFLAAQASLPAGYPSEAEIEAAYEQNKQRFLQPRAYHLAQIFLPRAAMASAEDGKRKLAPLRAQIQRGKLAFNEAAQRGAGVQVIDMGWVAEPQLVPAVKEAVAGLLEGALTDVVCTDNGCHLIKLIATRPAGPAPIADMREALVRALKQQKQSQMEAAYASALLAKQPAEINEIQLSRLAR
jgi:peptidylprolyl isomerase